MRAANLGLCGVRRRVDRLALAAACGGLMFCIATPSRADADADAENTAAARALGIEGVQLADAGRCPEALDKLQRAEALHHAPTILDRLGECQIQVGQVVEGTESLNLVVREQLPESAPQVFRDAQARAQQALARATPKIAHLIVNVLPTDVQATVTINGKSIPPALVGQDRPTNPGTSEVSATANGYLAAGQSVTLADGASQTITLTLDKDPNAVAALPAGTPSSPPPPPAPRRNHAAAFVAYGVGGAGLLVGAVTGILALNKAADCPDKVCPTQADLDHAKAMATLSTVGFGVGIVGAALGTVLLLVNSGSEAPPAAARVENQFQLRPFIGANVAGLTGSF